MFIGIRVILEGIGACRCYIKVPSKIKISILPQILLEMLENKKSSFQYVKYVLKNNCTRI